jgi:hypothetical protein
MSRIGCWASFDLLSLATVEHTGVRYGQLASLGRLRDTAVAWALGAEALYRNNIRPREVDAPSATTRWTLSPTSKNPLSQAPKH